mmetsp:Transcript_54730/g.163616  ORF Transcript_54730/g.163616 Transcript_54730/m.163616 type:complete len:237 (+) Transcript_54730:80-790(+)
MMIPGENANSARSSSVGCVDPSILSGKSDHRAWTIPVRSTVKPPPTVHSTVANRRSGGIRTVLVARQDRPFRSVRGTTSSASAASSTLSTDAYGRTNSIARRDRRTFRGTCPFPTDAPPSSMSCDVPRFCTGAFLSLVSTSMLNARIVPPPWPPPPPLGVRKGPPSPAADLPPALAALGVRPELLVPRKMKFMIPPPLMVSPATLPGGGGTRGVMFVALSSSPPRIEDGGGAPLWT